MDVFVQLFIFIVAGVVIWFFSGMLITAVDTVARRFNKSGFVVAFFVLGFLTSISEFSVAINATINGVPGISVGNIIGATFVILLLIVPLLAIAGNGIKLNDTLTGRNLFIALTVILLPAILVIDGNVTRLEGVLCVLAYVVLLFGIRNQPSLFVSPPHLTIELLGKRKLAITAAQIVFGGASIFVAGNILVTQSVYFAELLQIPNGLVGLLLLSIGTNIPEIVIAVRAILHQQKGIAFGDYLGSTVANTVLFAILALVNGTFVIHSSEFIITAILMTIGFILFYLFARSKDMLSRKEGFVLIGMYFLFLFLQMGSVAWLIFWN